jgi:Ser/Thr protein kinase RdoA (MazF antagonist)
VLKLSHPAEPLADAEFQTAALLHIERKDARVAVSHVIPTLAGGPIGEIAFRGGPRHVRLLSWMAGDMLCRVPVSSALLGKLGEASARLDLALADFAPAGGGQDLLWDFTNITKIHQLTGTLEGDMVAPLVEAALTAFENQAMPAMSQLRQQYVHNDLNPHNVLVAPDGAGPITGILDFGDMVQGALVGELAIACSYHLDVGDMLEGAAACVAGYHAVLPLTEQEMDLLPAFIAARLAMTVLITEWRAKQNPANGGYILRNNPAARKGLKRLATLGAKEARDLLASACG